MNSQELERVISAVERIGKVLGVLFAHHLGDAELGVKAEHLSRCGFSNIQIAELLGKTANSINVALHRVRKQKAKAYEKTKPKKS